MSAPFVWILACFAAGIFAGIQLHISSWILCAAAILAAMSLSSSNFRLALVVQTLLLFLLGHQLTSFRERRYENDLRKWVGANEQQTVPIKGVLLSTPEIAEDFFVLQLRVLSISDRQLDGVARVTVPGSLEEDLVAGDLVEMLARFRLPRNFRVEGIFDYQRYLKKEGIHVLGSLKTSRLLRKTGNQDFFRSLVSRVRLRAISGIIRHFSSADSGVLRALWLDDRAGLLNETEQMLIDAGVFHVIAISGFHVGVLLVIAFFFLKRVVCYRWALVILSILLLFYFLLLEGRSSITRSFFIFLIFAFASWKGERIQWGNALSLSALAQIVWNPFELFDSGFQLTYLATSAIVFLVVPVFSFVRLPGRMYRYLLGSVLTSLIVQGVLLPYQALVFHKIPFSSALSNFVAVPSSSLLIAIGSISWLVSWLPGLVVPVVHQILKAFLTGVTFFSERWLAVVPAPSIWVVACFYTSIALFIICRKKSGVVLSILTCAVCTAAVLFPVKQDPKNFFRVHFIDVGQGDAILLEYPDGTYDLVDAGGFWNPEAFDVGGSLLLPYLSHVRVSRLHRVFITHAHADHMGGMFTLLKYIPAHEVYVTRQPLAEAGYQRVIRERSLPPEGIYKGKEFRQGEVRIRVLAPEDARKSLHVRNDDSMVLLVECWGKRLLLPGDAEKVTEEKLAGIEGLKVDFLKAPHHGSKTSSSEGLLERIKMKAVFVSVGVNNWFGHPHPEILSRYRRRHAMVYRTDQLGTIRLTVKPDGGSEIDSFEWSH